MMNNVIFEMEKRAEMLNTLLLAQEADFTVEYVRNWKNNIELEGYVLKSNSINCAPTIYYHADWYNQNDAEVVSYLTEMFKKHSCQIDISKYTNKDYILSHIYPRLVSENNLKGLENRGIAYIKFLDMYILFYVEVNDDQFEDDCIATMQVSDNLLEIAGITLDEAYSKSLENLEKEAEIKTMHEILLNDFGIDCGLEEKQDLMMVLTTKKRIQGAATILVPSVIQKIEEKLGDKIVILPSSIHESLAVPYENEEDFPMFLNMVKEVNDTQVTEDDRLTYSVYVIKNHQLQIVY